MADKVFFVGPLERVLHLRTAPALEGLDSTELVRVAQFARERTFPKGSFLLEKGGGAAAFHLLVEGRVRVKRTGRPSHSIGPGEVVGFLNQLSGGVQSVEAQAEVDTLTLEFDADAQFDLCEEHFPILLNYARFLSRSLIRERRAHFPHLVSDGRPAVDERAEGPDLVTRILALNRAAAFRRCSLDGLGELARHLSEVGHRDGDVLWRVGEVQGWFALVQAGTLRRSLDSSSALLEPYSIVGMEEALAGDPRWHELSAIGEARVLRVEIEPFLDILEDHFEMAMALLSSMATELMELQEKSARLVSAEGLQDP